MKRMGKSRKRKKGEAESEDVDVKAAKLKATRGTNGGNENPQDVYPTHNRPTPQECRTVRDTLLALHGFPKQFAKYRRKSTDHDVKLAHNPTQSADPHDDDDDDDESVLDGLVRTILSQNTTEANSQRAFSSLKSSFPTWQHVLRAPAKDVEDAIRCGGLAPTKTSCIKNVLSCLIERRGTLCLEYLRDLSLDEIKSELSLFKGIGPKTVSCVLMFNLQRDDFPVDTHIFEIAKTIGWVPAAADRNKTYVHLNRRIPKELMFDLNCLLYTHGKLCSKCTSKRGNQPKKTSSDDPCPLLKYRDGLV